MADFVREGPALEVAEDPGALQDRPKVLRAREADIADDPQLYAAIREGRERLPCSWAQLKVHSLSNIEIGGEKAVTTHFIQSFDRIREMHCRAHRGKVLSPLPGFSL